MRKFQWLRALAQPTSYLGLMMIAVIWGGVFFLAQEERERAYADAVRQGSNLTRVFEEYIERVIKNTDNQILMLRDLYRQREQPGFDFPAWINDDKLKNDLVVQSSIIGPDGTAKFSTLEITSPPVNIKDRAHFLVHVNSTSDELYISEPVIGRLSGKSTIQLSRRLTAADGTFGGIIVISLDILQLQKFFNSVDIGRAGIISLIGFDGIIRARSDGARPGSEFIGKSVAYAEHFKFYRQIPAGSYWNSPDTARQLDGVRRLISYRVIEGLPLISVVGLAENDIFQQAETEARKYYLVALLLAAFILLAIGFAGVRQMKLAAATASLQQTNMRFDAAIENMAHGLCMFDRDKNLLVCNGRYGEMYGLTPDQTKPGTPLRAILEARLAVGSASKNTEGYIEDRLQESGSDEPFYSVRELQDGRIFAINHQPTQDGGWVGIHQDITDRRHAEQELYRTKKFLHTIIEHVPTAIVVKDPTTQKNILVNRAYEDFMGMPRDQLIGFTVFDVYETKYAEMIARYDAEALQSDQRMIAADFSVETKSRGLRQITTTRLVVCDNNDQPQYLIAVIEDATERKKTESQISFMAHHDLLTGLVNRTLFMEKVKEFGDRLQRQGKVFTILMLDLDRFKDVNDSLGHHTGDELLKQVGRRLQDSLRDTDTLARFGGDEFAILQSCKNERRNDANEQREDTNDQRESAIALAIRIIERLDEPFEIDGNQLNIGTSIGIALAPEDGADAYELMKKSDMALYRAKADGRNGYAFFDPTMTARADAHHKLANDLHRALANKEFELHYQPVIDVKTCKLYAVEALVRWRHPQKGLISPDQFIPVAEATGLIISLGEWVLQQACADAVTWPAHVKVAVNLSPVQFKKSNLMDVAICALVESGLPPQRLEIEITESVLLEDEGKNIAVMRQLKNLGISIALDDFGTGYSSLKYLTMFPFDKIKIDKSFTMNMTKNPTSAAIIAAVLSLGRSLDIATTAEGVETKQDFESLRVSGVNFAQGFLFSRPVPVAELDFDKDYAQHLMHDRDRKTVAHVA